MKEHLRELIQLNTVDVLLSSSKSAVIALGVSISSLFKEITSV